MNEDDMKNNKEEKRKEVLKDKSESALAFGAIFGGVAGVILLFESSLHTTANESTAPFSLTKGSPTFPSTYRTSLNSTCFPASTSNFST